MNDIASDRVGPMRNPSHLGELIRESMDEVGWNVTDTAARLGCERGTLSRLLERQGGGVGEHGARAGGYRLGDRRKLDADAGELRAGAGAPPPSRCPTARERSARMTGRRASTDSPTGKTRCGTRSSGTRQRSHVRLIGSVHRPALGPLDSMSDHVRGLVNGITSVPTLVEPTLTPVRRSMTLTAGRRS